MKRRSQILVKTFNELEGVTCNVAQVKYDIAYHTILRIPYYSIVYVVFYIH